MAETSVEKARERLLSAKFADFYILCGDREIPVHRTIVTEESRIVDSACTGKIAGFPTNRIEVLDTDSETVSRVLLFIYAGDYDDDTAPVLGSKRLSRSSDEASDRSYSSDNESTLVDTHEKQPSNLPVSTEPPIKGERLDADSAYTERLIANAKVYRCAKTLKVDGLVPVAEKKFVSLARNGFTASDFLDAARFVFEKTNPGDMGLRAQVLRICATYMESVKENVDMMQLLMGYEPLAWTLLDETKKRLMDNLEETVKVTSDYETLLSQNEKLSADVLAAVNQSRELMMRNVAIQEEVLTAKKSSGELTTIYNKVVTENSKLTAENKKVTAEKDKVIAEKNKVTAEKNKVTAEKNKVTAEKSNVIAENNNLKAEVRSLKDLINRAERRIRNVTSCRHCGQEFWAMLEVNLANNHFIVRCGDCTTKH